MALKKMDSNMQINSKWIIELNVRTKLVKCLEEKKRKKSPWLA